MVLIDNQPWNLLDWYRWLEDQGLEIGRDYESAWSRQQMSIRFLDGRQETLINLKLPDIMEKSS